MKNYKKSKSSGFKLKNIKIKKYEHFDAVFSGNVEKLNYLESFLKSYDLGLIEMVNLPYIKSSIYTYKFKYTDGNILKFNHTNKKPKIREIFKSSHRDSLLYSYFAFELNKRYNHLLKKYGLYDNILAYRLRQEGGDKKYSAVFAKEAVDVILNKSPCSCLVWDITDFYNCIDHEQLEKILKKKIFGNPNDTVYFREYDYIFNQLVNSVSKYQYVEHENYKEIVQHYQNLEKEGKLPSYYPEDETCYLEGHEAFAKNLIGKFKDIIKANNKPCGIAQGNALSNVLANISLLYFDIEVKKYCDDNNVYYRRYSDDILFIGDKEYIKQLKTLLPKTIKKYGSQLKLPNDKMQESSFYYDKLTGNLKTNKPFTYLGISFDGKKTSLSESSINKYLSQIRREIKQKLNEKYHSKVLEKDSSFTSFNKFKAKYCLERFRNKYSNLTKNKKHDNRKSGYLVYLSKCRELFKSMDNVEFIVPFGWKQFVRYHYNKNMNNITSDWFKKDEEISKPKKQEQK